jgi:hypothetical protein
MKTQLNELFEISEQTISLYKKYAADSKKLNSDDLLVASAKKSVSEISIVSHNSSNNGEKSDGIRSKYKNSKFFITKTNTYDFTCDPIRSISDKNLQVYLTHLKIGKSEAQEPSASSYRLYEAFVKTNSKWNI